MRPSETPPDTAMAGDTPPSTARRTLLLGGVATLVVVATVAWRVPSLRRLKQLVK